MDFQLNDEQKMLVETSRDFFKRNLPASKLRELGEGTLRFERKLWQELAELGWLGLTVPEELGGLGMSFEDAVLIQQEAGRAALPGPFLEHLLLVRAILHAGSPAVLEGLLQPLVQGEVVGTIGSLYGVDDNPHPGSAALQVTGGEGGGGGHVSGTLALIPYANSADLILAAGQRGHQPVLLLLDARWMTSLEVTPPLDITCQLGSATFVDVPIPAEAVLAEGEAARALIRDLLDRAALLGAADMVGAAEAALEKAVAHARDREQFGKPIGSFQAIKHKCADMFVDVQLTQVAVHYAAWATDNAPQQGAELISAAKGLASTRCPRVAKEAIQIHGGLGFSWEGDVHIYYKRIERLGRLFGDRDWHWLRLASLVTAPCVR